MARAPQFKFCPYCAAQLVSRPILDRERPVCDACGYIQFLSPVAGVAAVIQDDDGRVLLARKASTGEWHFPSGYVEWHEDVRESVTRELDEELGLDIEVGDVLAVHTNIDSPDRCTVGIWFSARVRDGRLQLKQPDEVDAADYFPPADAPPLAYENDRRVLDALEG